MIIQRDARPVSVSVLLIGAAIFIAVWAGINIREVSSRSILLSLIGVVLITPLIRRAAQQRFDLLEPLVWLNVSYFVMFFLRPLALITTDSFMFRGMYDIERTFDEALVLALIGAIALQVGYFAALGRKLGRKMPSLPATFHMSSTIVIVAAMLAIVLYSFVSIYVRAGGVNNIETPAYYYQLPYLVVPACLLLLGLARSQRISVLSVVSYSVLALYVAALLPTGRRLMLMQIVLAIAFALMIWRQWRPRFWSTLIIVVIGFYLIVSMRDLQPGYGMADAVDSIASHVSDTGGSIETLLTSNDTEMFDGFALELQAVPETFDYRPGNAFYLLITHPVPRLLWSGKPQSVENILNNEFFNVDLGQAGVAYSVLGGFYFDSGFVGIAAGMGLIGLAFRFLWEYHRSNPRNDTVVMVYAASLPFVTSILRGNLHLLLAIALFTVIPTIAAAMISGKRKLTEGASN